MSYSAEPCHAQGVDQGRVRSGAGCKTAVQDSGAGEVQGAANRVERETARREHAGYAAASRVDYARCTGGAVAVLPRDQLLAGGGELDLFRHSLVDKGNSVLLHVGLNLHGHLLIEAAQRDGAHHDRRLEARARDEPRALEGDVGRADDERLAGVALEREDVVGRDAMLLSARDLMGK